MSVNFLIGDYLHYQLLKLECHSTFGLKLTTHIKCQNWSRYAYLISKSLKVVSLPMLYVTNSHVQLL